MLRNLCILCSWVKLELTSDDILPSFKEILLFERSREGVVVGNEGKKNCTPQGCQNKAKKSLPYCGVTVALYKEKHPHRCTGPNI